MAQEAQKESKAEATESIDEELAQRPLTMHEKRWLKADLLRMHPEKLAQLFKVINEWQPQNVETDDDEMEVDLMKLNTRTLRHMQRYAKAVLNAPKIQAPLIPLVAPAMKNKNLNGPRVTISPRLLAAKNYNQAQVKKLFTEAPLKKKQKKKQIPSKHKFPFECACGKKYVKNTKWFRAHIEACDAYKDTQF